MYVDICPIATVMSQSKPRTFPARTCAGNCESTEITELVLLRKHFSESTELKHRISRHFPQGFDIPARRSLSVSVSFQLRLHPSISVCRCASLSESILLCLEMSGSVLHLQATTTEGRASLRIDLGNDLNVTDEDGQTPRDRAETQGGQEMMQILSEGVPSISPIPHVPRKLPDTIDLSTLQPIHG